MKKDVQKNMVHKKTKKKFYSKIIFIIICFALLASTAKSSQIINLGKYILDVIRQKNTNVRIIDDPNWAKKIDLPGLPNLHKVSDDLYRGAQPTEEGVKQLKELGVKTIVNLRSLHSDRDEIKDIEIGYEHIRMTTFTPDTNDIIRFLDIVTDSNNTPVFVHCQHGADRTGAICAIYRIIIQDWTKEKAIEEMTKGGYGFHSIWDNLVDYIRELDIEKIKQLREER